MLRGDAQVPISTMDLTSCVDGKANLFHVLMPTQRILTNLRKIIAMLQGWSKADLNITLHDGPDDEKWFVLQYLTWHGMRWDGCTPGFVEVFGFTFCPIHNPSIFLILWQMSKSYSEISLPISSSDEIHGSQVVVSCFHHLPAREFPPARDTMTIQYLTLRLCCAAPRIIQIVKKEPMGA